MIGAVVAVVGILGGFLIYRATATGAGPTPTTQATVTVTQSAPNPAESTSASGSPRPSTGSTSPASKQQQAGKQLAAQRAADRPGLSLDGRWIAQLSSKYDGVVDKTQVAVGGGHTFHLTDILAEHQQLRARFGNAGVNVYLLRATDFGRQRGSSRTIWVTIADPGLTSSAAISNWCRQQFSQYSRSEVGNVCMPRELAPPYR
ncbi:MAG: hypothetical protein QM582_08300 [Micropruina sp.]|uniref:hypothetical protein n=1 Tax=Micropruina sp. TaxID=2737536 RepID=UPI0039E28938